jgi:hypothetical protein
MIAVVFVGFGLSAFRLHRLRLAYLERARTFARSAAFYERVARLCVCPPPLLRKLANRTEFYTRMARTYEDAARYPWLPVPPDPPEPE